MQREENEVDYVSKIQGSADVTDFDQREKRSTPTPNYVETLAVIDYALYSRLFCFNLGLKQMHFTCHKKLFHARQRRKEIKHR